jgi:hypothetical protein
MTHTPGPWLLTGHTVYALDEVGQTNRFSCNMQAGYSYYGRTVKERVSNDELTANARLIAAAPELLEALRIARMQVALLGGEMDAVNSDVLSIADAAIAKATGGQ